jgi:DnaD/phage-associated family protein
MEIKGFNIAKKMLYSDTPVPDIFINQYASQMDSDYFKVYIYCLFLDKYNKPINENAIACGLNMSIEKVKDAFVFFLENGLAALDKKIYVLTDIKDKEVQKYIENKQDTKKAKWKMTKEQEMVIRAINNEFFQGVMGISWYSDIGTWFEKYKFDADVMYQLFHICHERNALSNNSYISKVAEDWYSRNIKTDLDLQSYLKSRSKVSQISERISKKLRLYRNLTEYEEKIVEKWIMDYGYDFDVIDLALQNTAKITNPNINYFDKIISDWYKKNLKDVKSIQDMLEAEGLKKQKDKPEDTKADAAKNPQQMDNFAQRQYDKEFLESLYEEL